MRGEESETYSDYERGQRRHEEAAKREGEIDLDTSFLIPQAPSTPPTTTLMLPPPPPPPARRDCPSPFPSARLETTGDAPERREGGREGERGRRDGRKEGRPRWAKASPKAERGDAGGGDRLRKMKDRGKAYTVQPVQSSG